MATRPLCSVDGCGKAQRCRGLCQNHYYRLRTHGDPMGGRTAPGEPLEWIARHRDHVGEDCLIWPYAASSLGYGIVMYGGSAQHASRVMCIEAHGQPTPEKPFALHSCGRGAGGCVHPGHLRWGDQEANMMDSVLEGTRSRGEEQHASKLTEDAVREIRSSKARQIDLAAKFGVVPDTIRRVRKRQAWAWLE